MHILDKLSLYVYLGSLGPKWTIERDMFRTKSRVLLLLLVSYDDVTQDV